MNHEGSKNSRSKLYVLRFITAAETDIIKGIRMFRGHDHDYSNFLKILKDMN